MAEPNHMTPNTRNRQQAAMKDTAVLRGRGGGGGHSTLQRSKPSDKNDMPSPVHVSCAVGGVYHVVSSRRRGVRSRRCHERLLSRYKIHVYVNRDSLGETKEGSTRFNLF